MKDLARTFKSAQTLLKARLKPLGFAYGAGNFRRSTSSGNILTIHIQKSSRSSHEQLLVTVNYGVTSRRVLSATKGEDAVMGDVWDAHWSGRIEDADGRERWLSFSATDDASTIADQLWAIVEIKVLPELESHTEDQLLLNEWLQGRGSGLTESQRLLYSLVLLQALGPAEKIPASVQALRRLVAGTGRERVVEAQLRMIGLNG